MAFGSFTEAERVGYMQSMMFATSTPGDSRNETLPASSTAARKKRRRSGQGEGARSTNGCYIKVKRVFLPAFAVALHLNIRRIQRHAKQVCESSVPVLSANRRDEAKKGSCGVQKIVVNAFLKHYASVNTLQCPTGRGSRDDSPLRILSSDTSKLDVHSSYTDELNGIIQAVHACESLSKLLEEPVS